MMHLDKNRDNSSNYDIHMCHEISHKTIYDKISGNLNFFFNSSFCFSNSIEALVDLSLSPGHTELHV